MSLITRKWRVLAVGALMVLCAPFAASGTTSPASVSSTTTINANITATISISPSTDSVSLTLAPTSGAVESANSTTVTVTTNDAGGYTLTLIDTDTTNALTSTTPSATIPATSGTYASPIVLATNTWGYHLDGMAAGAGTGAIESSVSPSSIKWAAPPLSNASAQQIDSTSSPATGGRATTIWWGANADTTKPNSTSGGYTDSVTLTATGA